MFLCFGFWSPGIDTTDIGPHPAYAIQSRKDETILFLSTHSGIGNQEHVRLSVCPSVRPSVRPASTRLICFHNFFFFFFYSFVFFFSLSLFVTDPRGENKTHLGLSARKIRIGELWESNCIKGEKVKK